MADRGGGERRGRSSSRAAADQDAGERGTGWGSGDGAGGAGEVESRSGRGSKREPHPGAGVGTELDIRIIVAHSKNRVIGRDGDMPWRLRDDLRFFREQTTGHTVVMGRKTYQSIGKPLPNRTNVVITRDKNFAVEGVVVVHSPEEALAMFWETDDVSGSQRVEHGAEAGARQRGRNEIEHESTLFVIGGGQIYEALLPVTNIAYITVVNAELEGDTRFPELGPEWKWTELRRHAADEHNDYSFTIYEVTREHD